MHDAQYDSSIFQYRGTTARHCPAIDFYCYLIHFEQRIGNPDKALGQAGHYLGACSNIDARLLCHRRGNSAAIMHAVHAQGIGFELVRLWRVDSWEASRDLEHALKRRHNSPQLCPRCNPRLGPDLLVELRHGHWPLSLHSHIGRRQPTGEPQFWRKVR